MRFHGNGEVNLPYLSDGMWFMTQFRRWGLLREDPDYLAVARQVQQLDIYREAATAVGVAAWARRCAAASCSMAKSGTAAIRPLTPAVSSCTP